MNRLDTRDEKILCATIQSYIASNRPVGSRTVTKNCSFNLSPATIRNIMANLEALGYLSQPHTSAGRIPTEKGYRTYVNKILRKKKMHINKILQQMLNKLHLIEKDINKLILETSKTLSAMSNYLGVATPPRADEIILKRIEFVKYEKRKVFGFLISEEGILKNKIIKLEQDSFTQKQLNKIAAYLNNELSGFTLSEIKNKIIAQLAEQKTACRELITDALMLFENVTAWETENMLYLGEFSGTCNLLDFADIRQIKELYRAIEYKHLMVKLLEKMSYSEGVKVLIGSENFIPELRELSMVGSTYYDGCRALGTIGVIGPTRMNYEVIIPVVEMTAKTLTQILSER